MYTLTKLNEKKKKKKAIQTICTYKHKLCVFVITVTTMYKEVAFSKGYDMYNLL